MLTLTQWLALEAVDATRYEEFWSDWYGLPRNGSVSSVKLTLADGQRVCGSRPTPASPPIRSFRLLQAGRFGNPRTQSP